MTATKTIKTNKAQLIDELFTLRQYADRLEAERDALKIELESRGPA